MKKIAIVLMICFICGTAWAIKGDSIDSPKFVTNTLEIFEGFSATTSFSLGGTRIINFELDKERNEIRITYRESLPWVYPEGGGPPDNIWKEVYGVDTNGKIMFVKKIVGVHIPAHQIDEQILFPEPLKGE